MITTSRHALRFGALDWKGQPDAAGWRMEALAEGASPGTPEPVEKELAHQLLDGSVKERTGYDNRVATFDVMIYADDSIALAKGGAALALACDSPSTLLFTPPDGLGTQTRFEVVVATPRWIFDDLDELNLRRRYRVSVECLPFGKSPDPTTDVVYPVSSPAGEQTVNACDSLTGFTGLSGSTASIDTSVKYQGTGSVKLTGQARSVTEFAINVPPGHVRVTETGTVELTGLSLTTPATRPFVSFKAYVGDCVSFSATLRANGVAADLVSAVRVNASWVTFTFRTDVTATITTLRFAETIAGDFPLIPGAAKGDPPTVGVPSSWAPRIDDILRNGAASPVSRQSMRSVTIGGSARGGGSLAISHPTNGLGKTLILTTPAFSTGFTPDLMKYCTVSTTTDTASISGKVKSFSATGVPVPFEFPAALLPPGGFQLVGVMETGTLAAGNAAIAVTMATKVGSTTLSTAEHQQRIEATGDGVFDFVDCGPITLPTTNVPAGSDATVALTITPAPVDDLKAGGTFDVSSASFQEFYLIPLAEGTALNIFDCGGTGTAALGTANNRLWLDSADLTTRRPSAWLGTEENRSDAYHVTVDPSWNVGRWQPLSLTPGELLLFLANSGGSGATATLAYTKSWLDLAAE